MKVTARQDREPIVDGILSGWKEVNLHLMVIQSCVEDNFPPPSRIFSLIIRIIFDRKDDEREGKEIREL